MPICVYMQQASDTKDGGSKLMDSFSSIDEGDQVMTTSLCMHTHQSPTLARVTCQSSAPS